MRVFCVHPGPLTYSQIFLRLEPIGLELVAAAVRQAGHAVRLLDLQVENERAYFRTIERWRPDVVAFGCNYLANVPEIVDLAKATKARFPNVFICVGGHSASFTAAAMIEHSAGAIDCVVKGEGEATVPLLLAAIEAGTALTAVPGTVTADGAGPQPGFVHSLDEVMPARDLLRHRSKYFVGILDPCASIEFSRGCPWDCSFCSAWTFYGRSYRLVGVEHVVEDLRRIREPGNLCRRRRGFCPSKPRDGIGPGDRPRRDQKALLSRNPRRRIAAQQGSIPVLEKHRPPIHFSRS